jgi:hypothetical protein
VGVCALCLCPVGSPAAEGLEALAESVAANNGLLDLFLADNPGLGSRAARALSTHLARTRTLVFVDVEERLSPECLAHIKGNRVVLEESVVVEDGGETAGVTAAAAAPGVAAVVAAAPPAAAVAPVPAVPAET